MIDDNSTNDVVLLSNSKKIYPFSSRNKLLIRAVFFCTLMIFVTIFNNSNFFTSSVNKGVACYQDFLFDMTTDINTYLASNITMRNLIMIISSAMVDFLVVVTCFLWVLRWDDWVLVISLLLFYFIRWVVMNFFILGVPNQYAFEYPGIPSLTVSYLRTNDFFYSGHAGFPIIFLMEYLRKGYHQLAYLSIFIEVVQVLMMIFLRGHYIHDLFIGIIMGFYMHKISIKYINPYLKRYL